MSMDLALTLRKIARNEFQVSTTNLSSDVEEVKLETTNLHTALAFIEEQQHELPYEGLMICGFAKTPFAVPEERIYEAKLEKSKGRSNFFHLFAQRPHGEFAQWSNLHWVLGIAEVWQHTPHGQAFMDLRIIGFSRLLSADDRARDRRLGQNLRKLVSI